MTVLSAKLDRLINTVELAVSANVGNLSDALNAGRQNLAVAVGSGGSLATAEYLAVCRNSLQTAPTLVSTPLELALSGEDLTRTQVWLFSAGGENADVIGALRAAIARRAGAIQVVTSTEDSKLALEASTFNNAYLHLVPVADPKDGFLATHSLVAAVTMLLRASDRCSAVPMRRKLDDAVLEAVHARLSSEHRAGLASEFASLAPSDTLILLADPRLSPTAVTVETSAWEAAICPVQRTDFRNFAHGRHVWLAQRGKDTLILSLTGTETRDIWEKIATIIPSELRRVHLNFGNCGRYQNALGVFESLSIVEAMGRACGIDPGKPGFGPFANDIYNAPSLEQLATRLTPAVRQKQAAVALRDDPQASAIDMAAQQLAVWARLGAATFRALVLDYDGTVVSTEGRFGAPRTDILAELERLLEDGLMLAFATGRGGSAGEQLRDQLPVRHHPNILMGYYNGAYLCPLMVDIREHPAPRNPLISEALERLQAQPDLFQDGKVDDVKDSGVQITINARLLRDPDGFGASFASLFGAEGRLRLLCSPHSFDICLADACKTKVVRAVAEHWDDADESVLCIGDSGARVGNDHALLGSPYGISVDQVCDRAEVCWSFFGPTVTGPDALICILRALRLEGEGQFRLTVDDLKFCIQE